MQELLKLIDGVTFDEEREEKREPDVFGPKGADCLRFPTEEVSMDFIDGEDDLTKLSVLQGEPLIGIDSEWRPCFTDDYA